MGQIYLTSDWHFCHDREFLYKPRGFDSVYDMNKAIIERHNEIVKPEDDVYVLGDCMLNNDELGLDCIKQLNGHLHLIRGNHDSDNRMGAYRSCWNVVEVCEGKFLNYKKYHFYLSHFPCITTNDDFDKPLKARTLNICGHSHTSDIWADANKGMIFHCEMDTNDCRPWSIDEIIEKFQKKFDK